MGDDKMPPNVPDWMPVPKKPEPLESWMEKRKAPLRQVDWVVERMIASGDLTILVGNGEVGKSWKAAHIATCIASGEFVDGIFPTKKGNVLWFDNENGQDENQRRAHILDAGKSLKEAKFAPNDVWFHEQGHWTANQEGLEKLRSLIDEYQPVLVIFDSLISIVPADTDTNTAKDIRQILDAITDELRRNKEKPIGGLILHHTKKVSVSEQDEWPTFLGSVDIRNAVSFMFLMREKVFTDKDGVIHKRTQWRADKHRRGKKDMSVYEFELVDHGEPKEPGFWVEYQSHGKTQEFFDYVADKIQETIPDGAEFIRQDLVDGIKGFPTDRKLGNRLIEKLTEKQVIHMVRAGLGQNPNIYAKVSKEKELYTLRDTPYEN